VDGAVSNAGVAVTGRIEALGLDAWSRSLDVNATSHFLLARRLLPALRAQGLGGSLVFVASKNAFSPGDGFGAYSVAKAAEVQLARIVALEGGADGVRANVVSPDAVFGGSRLWAGGLREERAAAHGVRPEELEGFYAARSLLKIPVRGVDVADAVAFCLSDRSSRMTGCVITVDAGVPAAFPR
jgi:NAD(P)-dependent dehydrogenase (short-subunit alcohol dehydrogenase family)